MKLVCLVALALVLAAACTDSNGSPTPTPASTPTATSPPTLQAPAPPAATATSTPAPETLLGLDVRPLIMAEPVPLPEQVTLYIESGCWGCDGPAAALQRVYRSPSGEVRTQDLFRLPGATVQQPEVDGRYITSIAMGGGDILLGVCESPYCGGVGEIHEGASVSFHHSTDGGLTWTKELTVDGGAWVIANFGGDPGGQGFGLLHRIYRPAPGQPVRNEFAYYPTLETQPIDLRGQEPNYVKILQPAIGPTFLRGADGVRLYRPNAAPSNDPDFDSSSLPGGATIVDFQYLPGAQQVLTTWTTAQGHMYTGLADSTNAPKVQFTRIFRWPDQPKPFFHRSQGGFIDRSTWIVAVEAARGQVPAIIDLQAATIRPIVELRERGEAGDRMLVKGLGLFRSPP